MKLLINHFIRFGSYYMDKVDIQLEMRDGTVVDSTIKYQGEGKKIW